jgi:serine O-acetyltransferase
MSPLCALKADIARTYGYTSGGRLKRILACARSPGLHAVIIYRWGQWLKAQNKIVRLLLDPDYVLLHTLIQVLWGIELPRNATIAPGLYIGHFGGITISSRARIGSNCSISQNVTIGVSGKGDKSGVPVIGNNVYIAPGARVFGKIIVGNDAVIGANAVVYRDVPNNAVVVLDPGFRIVSFRGNRPVKQRQAG